MSMHLKRRLSALVLVLLAAVPGRGEEPVAGTGTSGFARELRSSLGVSVNPIGLQEAVDLSWRRPLSASSHALLKDAHLSFGVSPRLAPAYARVGAWVQLAPLSVFELRAGVEPATYFGTFASLLYFDGYDSRFDADARRARSGEAAFGVVGRAYLAPVLKARAGRFALKARTELERWRARDGGPLFYETSRDTLLRAAGDSVLAADAVALYELRSRRGAKRHVGAAYDLMWVRSAPQNRRQTVGVVGAWNLGAGPLGIRQPTLYAKVFRYLEDPYKAGQLGAQLAVSFAIKSSAASR